jgi:hypothetical protein
MRLLIVTIVQICVLAIVNAEYCDSAVVGAVAVALLMVVLIDAVVIALLIVRLLVNDSSSSISGFSIYTTGSSNISILVVVSPYAVITM